jgi:hypothetical protein
MSQKNITKQNISLAAQLLRLEEQKAFAKKKSALEEGTPTTALPAESNATRQMQADVAAAMAKGGIPAPIGAEPSPNHGETAMGTQNPQGADSPASADYSQQGQQDGMVRPGDQRGSGGQGPASNTTDQNSTSGLGNKGPKMEAADILALDGEALIEAFIGYCGGVEEAIFRILAEGVSLVEAEAVFTDRKLDEGIFDKVKAGVSAALGGGASKKPSSGYLQHLQKRRSSAAGSKIDLRPNNSGNRDKPWSATGKIGHDARRNK